MKRLVIASLVVTLLAAAAFGATLLVPSQYTTIQAGINAASDGDTVLIASGTYTGTGNKNLDFGGREIVVMSEFGPEGCIIDCQSTGQGFYFHSGETSDAKVIGLTIKSGNSTYGGGIRINSSSPTIERCIIRNNNGSYGGGIYINAGNPSIIHCTLTLNTATNGGAMYSTGYANPIIKNCIVANNSSSG
jgi:hypothetical protein